MIVKAIQKFGDKTTGATYAEQVKIEEGQVFECDDNIAKDRSKSKLVKKATKEEEKAYLDSIDTNDDGDVVKPLEECTDNELWEIVRNENIEVTDSVGRNELIDIINKVRAERLEQTNGGEE